MAYVVIKSDALNGLMVAVDVIGGEVDNAFFASTHNELPIKMHWKLINNVSDMLKVRDEVEKLNG